MQIIIKIWKEMLRFHQALMILLFCCSGVFSPPSLIMMMWFRNKTYRLAKTSNGLPVRKFHLQNWFLFNLTKQTERIKNTIWNIDKLQIFSSVISKELWRLWWPRGSCWTKNKFVVCKDALFIIMVAIIRRLDVTAEKKWKLTRRWDVVE